jgi:hypothetical protein
MRGRRLRMKIPVMQMLDDGKISKFEFNEPSANEFEGAQQIP